MLFWNKSAFVEVMCEFQQSHSSGNIFFSSFEAARAILRLNFEIKVIFNFREQYNEQQLLLIKLKRFVGHAVETIARETDNRDD